MLSFVLGRLPEDSLVAEGMRSAVVDMWALSRTQKILGSFWSSFSGVASGIGQIEIQIVNVLAPE